MSVRIDKWLWAVRIFKSRTLATKACDQGKVTCKDKKVKASFKIEAGDIIQVKGKHVQRIVEVVECIEKRVSASEADLCYIDHSPVVEKPMYTKSVFDLPIGYRKKGEGRPTKKDRRMIDKYKKTKE